MKDLLSKIKRNRLSPLELILNDTIIKNIDGIRTDYYIGDCFIFYIHHKNNAITINREIYYRYTSHLYYGDIKRIFKEQLNIEINNIHTNETHCNLNHNRYEK